MLHGKALVYASGLAAIFAAYVSMLPPPFATAGDHIVPHRRISNPSESLSAPDTLARTTYWRFTPA